MVGRDDGPDGFTPLALAAAWTERVRLGTGIVNPFTRGPAVLAQHAPRCRTPAAGASSSASAHRRTSSSSAGTRSRSSRPLSRVRGGGRGAAPDARRRARAGRLQARAAARRPRRRSSSRRCAAGCSRSPPRSPTARSRTSCRSAARRRSPRRSAAPDKELVCRFFCIPAARRGGPRHRALDVRRATRRCPSTPSSSAGWAGASSSTRWSRRGRRATASGRSSSCRTTSCEEIFVFGGRERAARAAHARSPTRASRRSCSRRSARPTGCRDHRGARPGVRLRRLHPEPGEIDALEAVAGLAGEDLLAVNMVASADGRAAYDGKTRPAERRGRPRGLPPAARAGRRGPRRHRHAAGRALRALHQGRAPPRDPRGQRPGPRALRRRRSRARWTSPTRSRSSRTRRRASSSTPPATASPSRARRRLDVVRLDDLDPRTVVAHLRREYDVRCIVSEGGPTLNAPFFAAGVVDELFLCLAPALVGGRRPLTILEGDLPAALAARSPAGDRARELAAVALRRAGLGVGDPSMRGFP